MKIRTTSFWLFLLLTIALLLTGGCAQKPQNEVIGKKNDVKIDININGNTGVVVFTPDFASESGDVAQEAKTTAEWVSTMKDLFGLTTAKGAGVAASKGVLDGIGTLQDNRDSRKDYNNPQDNDVDSSVKTSTSTTATTATDDTTPAIDPGTYDSIHKRNFHGAEDGKPWGRFNDDVVTSGDTFGKQALVKIPECSVELFVADTSKDYTGDNGFAWVNGRVFDAGKGQGITGGIWGPKGCTATYYEVHYNK